MPAELALEDNLLDDPDPAPRSGHSSAQAGAPVDPDGGGFKADVAEVPQPDGF